jgi:hypothetical protein
MECRSCPSCFDTSIYPSYVFRKRKGSDPYGMRGLEDDPGYQDMLANMPSPGTPNWYEPDFELTRGDWNDEDDTNDASTHDEFPPAEDTHDVSTHREFPPTEDGDIEAYEFYETMDSPGSLMINPDTPPPGDEGEQDEAMVDHVEVANTSKHTSGTQ